MRIVLAAAALLGARSAGAQTFHGTVRDSTSHQPIAGAVFMLLDSSGVVLGRRITDEQGRYSIVVAGAPRWARVVRIGFQPREVRLGAVDNGTAAYDLAMLAVPTMLTAVSVRDKSHCAKRSDRAAALGLWEQARAGLLATVVARETNTASVYRLGFERNFDGASDKITRFVVRADSATGASKSFTASLSAEDFVATGFVHDSAGDQLLFGPDADVLVDDAFASGYCFRLAGRVKARPTQVGLSFSPAHEDNDRKRVDIDGTLWVDTAARAIVDIEYRYVGMAPVTDEYRPGGLVSFHQMPNGAVMIDHWYVRGVGARQDTISTVAGDHVRTWLFASESGGDLASATWPDGSAWHAPLGALQLHAVTAKGAPAAGARISLPDTPYRGTTDQNGDVRISDLEPGPYTVSVSTPPLSDIGLEIPTALKFVAVRDSTFVAKVKITTPADWVADRCVAEHLWDVGDSVFVVGRLVDARGRPVPNIKASFLNEAANGLWAVLPNFYTTGADGGFHVCNAAFTVATAIRIALTAPGWRPLAVDEELKPGLNAFLIRLPAAP
ncbi:MAG: carboxypeptidase-like regulatory domain-containing protein [Gemmatimonadaceae bacterium]